MMIFLRHGLLLPPFLNVWVGGRERWWGKHVCAALPQCCRSLSSLRTIEPSRGECVYGMERFCGSRARSMLHSFFIIFLFLASYTAFVATLALCARKKKIGLSHAFLLIRKLLTFKTRKSHTQNFILGERKFVCLFFLGDSLAWLRTVAIVMASYKLFLWFETIDEHNCQWWVWRNYFMVFGCLEWLLVYPFLDHGHQIYFTTSD